MFISEPQNFGSWWSRIVYSGRMAELFSVFSLLIWHKEDIAPSIALYHFSLPLGAKRREFKGTGGEFNLFSAVFSIASPSFEFEGKGPGLSWRGTLILTVPHLGLYLIRSPFFPSLVR